MPLFRQPGVPLSYVEWPSSNSAKFVESVCTWKKTIALRKDKRFLFPHSDIQVISLMSFLANREWRRIWLYALIFITQVVTSVEHRLAGLFGFSLTRRISLSVAWPLSLSFVSQLKLIENVLMVITVHKKTNIFHISSYWIITPNFISMSNLSNSNIFEYYIFAPPSFYKTREK